MRRRKRSGEDDESEIDLTPMLDVVFIMLIFFIVTATFVKEIGLDVNRPPPNNQPPPDQEKKNILIVVSQSDRITIDNRSVDLRAVRANIERLHAENPEFPVVIKLHDQSSTNSLIQIMDYSRQAGVYNISIAE
ncbi:MAG: biopolymer transporter ExbD [Pseudomonadota bacterium]